MAEIEERRQRAETILQQLGGGRFRAMTGARHFLATETGGLVFQFGPVGRGERRMNFAAIELDPSDTYNLTFGFASAKVGRREVENLSGVYAEDLQRIFTDVTGMDTHL